MSEQWIVDLLTENTGRHMLDSGGACGRHWESNLKVTDWDATAEVWWYEICGTIGYTLSLYHWLKEHAVLDAELDAEFLAYCNSPEHDDDTWNDNAEDFVADKGWRLEEEDQRIEETNLSQAIHCWRFADEDDWNHYALSIHNGCDYRGGWTRPRFVLWPESSGEWPDLRGQLVLSCYEHEREEHLPGIFPPSEHKWSIGSDGCNRWDGSEGLERQLHTRGEAEEGDFVVDVKAQTVYCPLCGGRMAAYSG